MKLKKHTYHAVTILLILSCFAYICQFFTFDSFEEEGQEAEVLPVAELTTTTIEVQKDNPNVKEEKKLVTSLKPFVERKVSLCDDIGFAIITTSENLENWMGQAANSWIRNVCSWTVQQWKKGNESQCILLKNSIKKMKEDLHNKQWYLLSAENTLVFPEKLVDLAKHFDSELEILVGSDSYVVVDEGKHGGTIVKEKRRTPYPPFESRNFYDHIKVIDVNAGALLTGKMLTLLYDNMDVVGGFCKHYDDMSIVLSKSVVALGGVLLENPAFHQIPLSMSPTLSKSFRDNYFLSNAITQVLDNADNMVNYEKGFEYLRKNYKNVETDKYINLLNKSISLTEINYGETATRNMEHMLESEETRKCVESINIQEKILIDTYTRILKGVTKVAVLGFPNHYNRGDAAIWVGERVLLRKLGIDVVYMAREKTFVFDDMVKALGDGSDVAIMLHGGGNFGDIYPYFHLFRIKVIPTFLKYKVIMFPQSTSFKGTELVDKTRESFKQHPDFTLVARDLPTYKFMKESFPENSVVLTPDIVFSLGYIPHLRPEPISKILLFERTDEEKPNKEPDLKATLKILQEIGELPSSNGKTGMVSRDWGPDEKWWNDLEQESRSVYRTLSGFNIISTSEIAIVDRLHAHIFSVLLGIPHILIDNRIGKLSAYHNTWTFSCPKAQRANSKSESIGLVNLFFENRWNQLPEYFGTAFGKRIINY